MDDVDANEDEFTEGRFVQFLPGDQNPHGEGPTWNVLTSDLMDQFLQSKDLKLRHVLETQYVTVEPESILYKVKLGNRTLKMLPYVLTQRNATEDIWTKWGWVTTAVLLGRVFDTTPEGGSCFGFYGVYCKLE